MKSTMSTTSQGGVSSEGLPARHPADDAGKMCTGRARTEERIRTAIKEAEVIGVDETGLRRSEVISLRGKDVHPDETLTLAYRAKGGDYRSREVREPQVEEALLDYLSAAKRMRALKTDAPHRTRHDREGKPALSSHCFVKNLKKCARGGRD